MNSKQFQKYLDRDKVCVHCGTDAALIPHHRLNRGMGGSKSRDVPSNIIVMCASFNQAMEQSAEAAQLAKDYGWKLTAGQDPEGMPVWYGDAWYGLDNNFRRIQLWRLEYEDQVEWF